MIRCWVDSDWEDFFTDMGIPLMNASACLHSISTELQESSPRTASARLELISEKGKVVKDNFRRFKKGTTCNAGGHDFMS
jgi:hypothetical protein